MGNTVRSTAVKGGTPVGSASLCRTCSSAHIVTGYRESDLVTICTEINPHLLVPFVVHECTNYWDKNRPSWDDMKKLALNFSERPLKPVGFKTNVGCTVAATARPDEDHDQDEIDDEYDD